MRWQVDRISVTTAVQQYEIPRLFRSVRTRYQQSGSSGRCEVVRDFNGAGNVTDGVHGEVVCVVREVPVESESRGSQKWCMQRERNEWREKERGINQSVNSYTNRR